MAEQLPVPVQYTPYQVDVSPDGTRVLYVGGDAYLRELALSAARRITSQLIPYANTFPSNYTGGNAWTSDGQWIVTCATDRIYMVEVNTGLLLPLPWSEKDYTDPSWKP